MTVDPLQNYSINAENYDIDREAYVYWSSDGSRAWTKAKFNGRDKLERSVPVSILQAWMFCQYKVNVDDWLSRYFPKQMSVCQKVLEQTRHQIIGF